MDVRNSARVPFDHGRQKVHVVYGILRLSGKAFRSLTIKSIRLKSSMV